MNKSLFITPEIFHYLIQYQPPISQAQQKLKNLTQAHRLGFMCTDPIQVSLMVLLSKLIRAENIIEIGVFTGLTSLALAETLPDHGKLIACDISQEFVNLGLPYWEEAGVKNKIDLKIQPGLETLQELLDQNLAGTFDLIYIDADKINYIKYFDLAFKLIKKNGLILADNTLRTGLVADLNNPDKTARHMREFNNYIKNLNITFNLLPIGDGLMMVLKE